MADFDRYAWALAQPGDWFSVRVVPDPGDVTAQEIALTRKELLAGLTCGQVPTPAPPTIETVKMTVINGSGVNVRAAPTTKGTILRLLGQGSVVTVETTTTTADSILWRKVANEQAYVAEKAVDGSIVYIRLPN